MGWKPYLFRQTIWSYDDGILVYAPTLGDDKVEIKDLYGRSAGIGLKASRTDYQGVDGNGRNTAIETETKELKHDYCLRILDLERGHEADVPFDVNGKIIRNLRIKEKTLIVEWAERDAFHELNMVDRVHRHFATCYDIRIHSTSTEHNQSSSPANAQQIDTKSDTNRRNAMEVIFRSEWRIHFLGFPLTSRDHFFSTHTSTHYAIYYWQPNRSLWTGDEDQPIEALFIFDISQPSAYRPSLDPQNLRARNLSTSSGKEAVADGPHCIARYTMRELEWLGIRQQASISLMKIELDSVNETITWRENRHVSGQGYFDPAERCWESRSTMFPFVGEACAYRWTGGEDTKIVSYRGHCSMDSDLIRTEAEKWFLPVCEVGDDGRNDAIRFSVIETCFTGVMVENKLLLRVRMGESEDWINLDDETAKSLCAMGKIQGDERWLVGQNERLQVVIARFQ